MYLNTSTTIENKLNSKVFKLISNIDDYKFHLFEQKNNGKLKNALQEDVIDFSKHFSKLQKWCSENLKLWALNDKDESIFKNAETWCTLPKIRFLREKLNGNLHNEKVITQNLHLRILRVMIP